MKFSEIPVHRPWLAIALFAIISGLSFYGNLSERGDRNLKSARAKTDYEFTKKVSREFGPDGSDVLILITHKNDNGDLFDKGTANSYKNLLKAVRKIPAVSRAFSFDQIPSYGIGLLKLPLFPDINDSDSKRKACRKRALNHPIVAGNLLSADARTSLVPLSLKRTKNQKIGDVLNLIRIEATKALQGSNLEAKLTGRVPIDIARREAMKTEKLRFQIIGYVLSAILALIFFRGLVMTLIVTFPPAVGVFWTIGMLGFTHERLNSLSMVIMPIILTMIGFTNAAHIVFQFRRELNEGSSAKESMAASMRKLGLPCMLSALTTAAGFASLTVAEANMISDFGRDCAVGTLITFMAVVLLLPLLGLLPFKHKIQIDKKSSQLDSVPGKAFFLKFIGSVIKRSKWVVTVSVILTILFGWLTSTLKPDMYLLNQLPDKSESGEALIEADKSLGGIQAIRIVAEWKSDDSDPVPIIASIEAMIKEEELLSQPLSIRGVLSSLPGLGKDLSSRMPLLKRAPPDLIKPLYRPELKKAVVITRIQDLGVAQYTPVYERLENKLKKLKANHPDYEFGLAGGAVGWGRYVHRMLNDLARSLAAAAIIILIMITIAYRSLRIGLIAMIPNLFPLLACAAVLAAFELPLSLEIVCAFTICLGIAADDAIHFLSRYQAERKNGLNIDQALECSFLRVGQVLIATTVVMLCGLGSVLFSSLPMYRAFTAVACATLSTALIADLIILPALLKLFHNKKV
ncbi:MAG: hypothetical protein EVB09_01045 [Verrucomicrobiaceae bacterium]|nr:MAG: hypothetical protein EVB09_01045 [Verrucomicrobiaceae bacterium]